MIIRYIIYFTVLQLVIILCQAAIQQRPFKQITSDSVSLQSIYHHSPKNSSIPYRFQKLDISTNSNENEYRIKSVIGMTWQPNLELMKTWSRQKQDLRIRKVSAWDLHPTPYLLPDVQHYDTVLSLAEMSYNAYTERGKSGDWYDLGTKWRINSSFGWDADGLRGHVFGNDDNSLLIISFKGTSAALFNGEPTGENDKLNDNMLFSCCCGKAGRGWTPVCGCNDDKVQYQCDSQCLDKSLIKSELYYDYAARMYMDIADQFPEATVWFTGHSLGGAVASLMGQTFGVPAVTFESPGDRMASQRLHLPRAPGAKYLPIWHFGHTADPLFIGVCTGPLSGCYYAGFAMESRCHSGKVCVWDTVKDHGWKVNIATHRIGTIIENIIKKKEEFPLPSCRVEDDCEDCGLWKYIDKRDSLSFLFNDVS